MVERDVVEDGDAGIEQRNRAVALVHFADENLALADRGAGKRGLRIHEVLHIGAVHDRWIHAGAVQNPADHADRGGLAARTGDTDAYAGSVEERGKQLRTSGDGSADTTRRLYVGHCLLNSSGRNQDLAGPDHAAAILRMEQQAARTQKIKPFGVTPLVERAVRTLDPSPLGPDDQSEWGHAAAADAAKKIVPRHGPKLTGRFQSSHRIRCQSRDGAQRGSRESTNHCCLRGYWIGALRSTSG